jgi:hypothetical protein
MQGKRTDISRQLTELDVKNMNDMFRDIYSALFGNLDFKNMNNSVKEQLFTYPCPINGEGNLDDTHPLYIYFKVPADAKKIKDAKINAMVTNYRMDAATTSYSGSVTSATTITSGPSSKTTTDVRDWYGGYDGTRKSVPHPPYATKTLAEVENFERFDDDYTGGSTLFFGKRQWIDGENVIVKCVTPIPTGATAWDWDIATSGEPHAWLDLARLNHYHIMDHTHTGQSNITIPGHGHNNVPGILESTVFPNGVKLYINDVSIGDMMNGSSAVQNDIDISAHIKIGEWNVIKITSYTVARITIYGTIEVSTRIY